MQSEGRIRVVGGNVTALWQAPEGYQSFLFSLKVHDTKSMKSFLKWGCIQTRAF